MGLSFPEVNVFLDDIAFQSNEAQSYLKEYGESLKEMRPFEQDQYTPGVEATQWVRLLPISVPSPDIIFRRLGWIPSIYFTIKN